MQLASSIRYGGLLVNASDCNYEDYRNLGLVCLNCHESVFLVQEHDRHYKKTNKTITVAQHFNHREDKSSEENALCELRVKQITSAEIERRENTSRNQRLRLFNRHLWNILQTCYKLENVAPRQQLVDVGFAKVCPNAQVALQIQKGYTSLLSQMLANERSSLVSQAEQFINDLRSKVTQEQVELHENLQPIIALWRQAIDRKTQVEIYQEVIAVLVQKKHLPILEKLIELSLYNLTVITALSVKSNTNDRERLQMLNSFFASKLQLKDEAISEVFDDLVTIYLSKNQAGMVAIYNFVRSDILETIALTPWAESFEKYAKCK